MPGPMMERDSSIQSSLGGLCILSGKNDGRHSSEMGGKGKSTGLEQYKKLLRSG